MRILITSLAASALLFPAAGIARSADAIEELPMAPDAQEVLPGGVGWDGAYVGGKATYQWGRVKLNKGLDAKGPGAGLYSGYNMQNDRIVYGGEVDLNYSGIDASYGKTDAEQGINGSLRARVGYDINPALVYGTAGLAVTDLKVSDRKSSDNQTLLGLSLGAGVETAITDTITARTEYRFNDYQQRTFELKTGNKDRGLQEHQLNVGLGVKF